jgi:hypothetical protein
VDGNHIRWKRLEEEWDPPRRTFGRVGLVTYSIASSESGGDGPANWPQFPSGPHDSLERRKSRAA